MNFSRAIIILYIQSLVHSSELAFTQKLKYQQPQPNNQTHQRLSNLKTTLLIFTLTFIIVFSTTAIALPVNAQSTSVQTIVLSNEQIGLMLLGNKGYVTLSIYDTLVKLQTDSNPSLSGVISSQFLGTLHSLPSSSQIFTKTLGNYEDWNAIAISTDGSVQTVSTQGSTYLNAPGTSKLDTQISNVANFRAIYSTSQTPIVSFTNGNTTYNIFAILYLPSDAATINPTATSPPVTNTPTTPEFPSIILLPLALAMLFAVALIKRKSLKLNNSSPTAL